MSQVPVQTSNFAYLAGVNDRLHTYATAAERLCSVDPEACLARLRKLADWMARALARQSHVDASDDLVDVMRRIESLGEIGRDILDPLNKLRIRGNRAVHVHTADPCAADAADGLRLAWGLCRAYARHVGTKVELPARFILPSDLAQVAQGARARVAQAEEEVVQLRAELAGRPAPMPADELARQLRELAAETQTPLQFAGLATHGRGLQLSVEDIYVHRSFTASDGSALDHEAFLARLESPEAPRWVVLGAAGAGKTTLCRQLVGALAQRGRTAVFVRLRALGGEVTDDLDALLDGAARWIRAQYSLVVTAEDVAGLLDTGSTVVLFDGFDELTGTDARIRIAERVHAFAMRFRGASVVVTSREPVLHETPLNPVFLPLRLDPFTVADASRLTARLFAAAGLGSVEEAHALVDRLSERARLREMLWTPLTVTLLAFLRADMPQLPASTCAVLEQCVRTWTDRWPKATDRPASPIARAQERDVLEGVARALIERADQGCALGFGELIAEVARLRRRDDPSISVREAEMRAEDWLEHHLAHVGLLEEDESGHVYFAHWSLMQYLAACASSADEIAAWAADLAHQDLCFLACELHSHESGYLERVTAAVVAAPTDAAAHWLLRSAVEGVAFAPTAVIAACERLVHAHRLEVSERNDASWRYSPRMHLEPAAALLEHPHYAAAMRSWACGELGHVRGEALLRMVIWGIPMFGVAFVVDALSARADAAAAAEDLLPLWPSNWIGLSMSRNDSAEDTSSCDEIAGWVVQRLNAAGALRWARSLDDTDLLHVATAGLTLACGPALEAALSVAVAARTLALGFTDPGALAEFCRRRARDRTHAVAMPGKVMLQLGFRTPVRPRTDSLRATRRHDSELEGRVLGALSARFPENWVRCSTPPGPVARKAPLPRANWSPAHPNIELDEFVAACHEVCRLPEDLLMIGIMNVPLSIEELQARRLVVEPIPSPPRTTPQVGAREPRFLYLYKDAPGAARFDQRMWSAHYGEALLALFATEGLADSQRRAYLDFRLQGRWLLEAWPLLEERWCSARTDTGAALLLALGWAQHASTGQWPDTRLWSDLVAPKRDASWLVRAHAHLCWLACDGKSATHRAGLRRALHEGAGDPKLGAVAEAWRALLADR